VKLPGMAWCHISCHVIVLVAGLTICGVDCLLSTEWKSPNKIIARTGQARGTGDIVVVTRSGGVGTTTVQFRGYNIQIGNILTIIASFLSALLFGLVSERAFFL